jgi:hypothetical protein
MEVIVNEMSSTLRATDSTSLLNPQVLERIVRAAVERMKEVHAHERAVDSERKLRPSMTARESSYWE